MIDVTAPENVGKFEIEIYSCQPDVCDNKVATIIIDGDEKMVNQFHGEFKNLFKLFFERYY